MNQFAALFLERSQKSSQLAAAFAAAVCGLSGCGESTGPEGADPRLLSGGNFTVFTNTSEAYGVPSPVVSDLDLHLRGDLVSETGRVSRPAEYFGGLGPVYNHISCAGCHVGNGRTLPDFWTIGGSGPTTSNFLVRISTPGGDPIPGYGTVLHDQAILGATAEARIAVDYTIRSLSFEDGDAYSLADPNYSFSDWYTGGMPADFTFSPRVPTRLVGLGLLRAVTDETILALAESQTGALSGRPNWVRNYDGDLVIGRFGLRAERADLGVENAFHSDLGVTTFRFPEEVYAEQDPAVDPEVLLHPPDVEDDDLNAVDFYFHTLGVPARRNLDDPAVIDGEELFRVAGCDGCHVPTLETGSEVIRTALGTPVPEVNGQLIHPYTDLLLHDMGPELADEKPDGVATGSEWRTIPLWGIGLQPIVDGHSYYMHDGRARDLMEAVMWHGGEARESREIVRGFSSADRAALVAFLKSL